MTGALQKVVTLASESSTSVSYDNHPIAEINDHVVRISVMTQPYYWHLHPNSDETFPGQMITVPRGLRHRTSPIGDRSVNLTFEAANAETVADAG